MKKNRSVPFIAISFLGKFKIHFVLPVFLFATSLQSYGQCNGELEVVSYGGCGTSRTLDIREPMGYGESFRLYKKSSTGYYSFWDESPAEYGGYGSFSVNVTTTTTFGVTYFDEDDWCESPKHDITVSPSSPPSVDAEGYSCEYGTAYIQAHSPSSVSSYHLYRYSGGVYQLLQNSSTGSFTVDDFNTDDTNYISNYYVKGTINGCTSGYSEVFIDVMRPDMPTVTGNVNPCYGASTTLTASGGSAVGYQWYQGASLISGATGSQYNTGNITTSRTYYVSYKVQGQYSQGQCSSLKRTVPVTVHNPQATAVPQSRCGPGDVTLESSAGFSVYNWYNQNGSLLGSTLSGDNTLTVSSASLTSYSVKVKDSYNCWSGMSSGATVTTTHLQLPGVYQDTPCGPGTHITMHADYTGERAGDYYIEWYAMEEGGSPEYSAPVSQLENSATYDPNLPSDKNYWVSVYDPMTSSQCRTERTSFLAEVGAAPSVFGSGYSCEYATAYIQGEGSSDISMYYLYKQEDTGSGLNYYLVDSNSTGSFTLEGFNSDDATYVSNYYIRGRSNLGCWSNYFHVDIDVMRPEAPAVTGTTNVCYNNSTLLTAAASGGFEGNYRWYMNTNTNLIPDETGSAFNTGPLTTDRTYYVSYIVEALSGAQCESPKQQVDIDIKPLPQKPSAVNSLVKRCGTGTVTLEAAGEYAQFQWYDDNGNAFQGATSASFSPEVSQLDEETTYKVMGISAFGCESDLTEIVATGVSKCENYVHEELIRTDGIITEDQIATLPIDQKTDTWNYYDGLGRTMQTIMEQFSPLGNDIVQPIAYDVLGRQQFTYLPYTLTSANDGHYRSDAIADQASFYESLDHVDPDSQPWSEKEFAPSPLNRVTEQGAPGESWQPATGHSVKFQYLVNDGSENIFNWHYDYSSGTIVRRPDYGVNQLYVNVTVDEQGHATREYKDKQDHIILKKVQEAETPGTGHTGWLCTYYVYDDFGNLKAVIPPQAVSEMDDAFNYTLVNDEVFSKNWLFKYKYDSRHRIIEKQVPGAQPVFLVYDQWDRLVLTQNGEQRKTDQWGFTKYDHLNRPVLTGLVVLEGVSAAAVRINVGNSAIRSEQRIATGVGYTLTNTYPTVAESDLLTVTYYDNYDFPFAAETGFDYFSEIGISSSQKSNVTGLVTGEMTRVLDAGKQWLKKVTYYDGYRRVSQTISNNHLGDGGLDRTSTKYDFTGAVRQTLLTHMGNTSVTISETFDYDDAGRLEQVTHQVNGQDPVVLAAREYNETGSLIRKKLHEWTDPGTTGTFAQSVDYYYNVRGWLTAINDPLLTDVEDLFGMQLLYENGASTQFNGNISAMQWKNAMQEAASQYGFTYDAANRLTSAAYAARSSADAWNVNSGRYNATIDEYDKNGNIMGLTRYTNNSGPDEIDKLVYQYGQGTTQYSNQLIGVSDNSTSADKDQGFKDAPGDDYVYDDNGNLKEDGNKGVTGITYNYLDLPQTVAFGPGNRIEYTYDAAGAKLRQQVYEDNSLSKTTDYLGPMLFEDNALYQIATPEGRLVPAPTGGDFIYQYHLTDHLGNVRLTFQEGEDEFFLATMESDDAEIVSVEEGQFANVAETRQPFGSANQTPGGNEVSQLDSLHAVGPAISLDVLPGDVINIETYAYYEGNSGNSHTQTLDAMIALVAGAYGGVNGGTESAQTIFDGVDNALTALGLGGTDNDAIPAAYLRYILFDRSLTYQNAGWLQVTSAGHMQKERIAFQPITITQPGIIYVYVSNESDQGSPVYFDDLKVTHDKKLEVVQADDYYPFGMRMAGLGYEREDLKNNDYLYNGKELQEELDLGWVDYGARMYMPEIAKWAAIDAHADTYYPISPYSYCVSNPINLVDLFGLDPVYRNGRYYDTDEDGNEKEVSWDYVYSWMQKNDGIGATYSFKSKGNENAQITNIEGKGEGNSFLFNGAKFVANSLATFMGRDDRDNSVGAFSTIYTMSESDIVTVLGHGAAVIIDLYKGNVENAMLSESLSGRLDYKKKVYDLLGIDRDALIQINGVVYNANEAGNYLWGMVIEYHGGLISPNALAEAGTRLLGGRHDERWEQKAISAGRQFGTDLLKKGNDFKKWVLQRRQNARVEGL